MDAYVAGELTGRFLLSFFLIYLIVLVIHRFKLKLALRRSLRPWPLAATLLVFILGLATSVHAQERAKRPFEVTPVPEAGIQLYVPARPRWEMSTERRADAVTVILNTPAQYYPPTAIEITYHPRWILPAGDGFREVASSTLNTARQQLALPEQASTHLQSISYGSLDGYQELLTVDFEGQQYQLQNFMGRMPSGHAVTVLTATGAGQLSHISHIVEKIIKHIEVL